MNSFELFCEVLLELLLRSLLFSRTFLPSFRFSLYRSLEATCLFYHFYAFLSTPFFAFCFFYTLFPFSYLFLSILLCSVFPIFCVNDLLGMAPPFLTPHSSLILPFPPLIPPLSAFSPMSLQNMVSLRQKT